METGTTKNVIDMWGCGDSLLVSFGDDLKRVNDKTVTEYSKENLSGWITSIWYSCDDAVMYAISNGVYKKSGFNQKSWQFMSFINSGNAQRLVGTGQNDIYLMTYDGYISHFNGKSWKDFNLDLPKPKNVITLFYWISVKEQAGAFVGRNSSSSYVYRFKHL